MHIQNLGYHFFFFQILIPTHEYFLSSTLRTNPYTLKTLGPLTDQNLLEFLGTLPNRAPLILTLLFIINNPDNVISLIR